MNDTHSWTIGPPLYAAGSRIGLLAGLCWMAVGLIPTHVAAHPPGTDGSHADHDADTTTDAAETTGNLPPTPAFFESAYPFLTTRPQSKYLPPADDQDVFHFVVYGDRTGGVPEGLKVLEQAVIDTNLLAPDLVMTVGDLIQGYNETEQWLQQMNEYQEIMSRLDMKWFPVAGNHDVYWRGPTPPPPGQHESNYEKHFGPLWYSFRHKNCGFIALYSDEGDPVTNEKAFNEGRLQTMSDEQLQFLQAALDDLVGADHVFVFLHHPRWIGGGYAGGNWDVVHQKLRAAGNVTAVFAGHIHHMRFDGPTDGIQYHTLATTGGHLAADIPDAGYLHHLNMVTVRPGGISVAALPIGSVIDPKQFTPEFLAEIEAAVQVRPVKVGGQITLDVDGGASGEVTYRIDNTSSRPIQGTLSLGTSQRPARDWTTTLDHSHFDIPPGEAESFTFKVARPAGDADDVSVPALSTQLEVVGSSARVRLPEIQTPLELQLAAVPADYFTKTSPRHLQVTGDNAAVRVDSDEFTLADGPITVEAWVKPSQLSGYLAILAKTQGSEYALFFDEGVPQFDIHLDGKYVTAKATTTLPTDRFTHLAGVFDGQQVRLYVDGRIVDTRPGSGRRRTNTLPLYIGADPDQRGIATRAFLGAISEVRLSEGAVYDAAFTPQRRLTPTDQTRLLMHLDNRIGPFTLDHSGSGAKGLLGTTAELIHDESAGTDPSGR